MIHTMTLAGVAYVCHEANRAYCAARGDNSQVAWAYLTPELLSSTMTGLQFVIDNPNAPDSAQHDSWAASKVADGWVYGPVKDGVAKTHPCLVPFDQLPLDQQAKDTLFRSVAKSLLPLLTPIA